MDNPGEEILLDKEKIKNLIAGLDSRWKVRRGRLEKEFSFSDFQSALLFVNKIAGLAESENHHPRIELDYGKVRVSIFTHKVNGLTIADFILAEQIGEINF